MTPNVVSVLTARTQLGEIIKRATQKNERFVVGVKGEPSVIIMSMKDYINAVAPAPPWLAKIQAASKKRGTGKLTMRQIDKIVGDARREYQKKN